MIDILEKIRLLTEQLLEGTDMFVVNMKIKPVNNIKVYLDADSGLSISKSAAVNRKLYTLIEETKLFPDGDFSLEVSSPGIDEPLANSRQYKHNIGRTVLVTLKTGVEKLGVLKEVTDDGISVEIAVAKDKKKKIVTLAVIPFSEIDKTVVQIVF
jgi:ribosome maturation factor RimP